MIERLVFDNSRPMQVRYYRNEVVESVHQVHVVVMDVEGKMIARAGNESLITYMRSSAKPLQAIPVLSKGVATAFHLNKSEIALICASHSGESYHISGVMSILNKCGLREADLQCGPHLPFDKTTAASMIKTGEVPRAIHNNCSGKHAGLLGLAKHIGEEPSLYMDQNSEVQQLVLEAICITTDMSNKKITQGIDGCGLPIFALPLNAMALAYARLACERYRGKYHNEMGIIREAMQKYPMYIAGTGRNDTILMQGFPGILLSKEGAEGVWCIGIVSKGWGISIKVEDGSNRAMMPALLEVLVQLGVWNPVSMPSFNPYYKPDIENWANNKVGKVLTCLV